MQCFFYKSKSELCKSIMKFLGIFVRIWIFFLVKIFLAEAKNCAVDRKTDMNQNAPPLVSFTTNPPNYLNPQGNFAFQTGSIINVACPDVTSTASTQVNKNRVLVQDKLWDTTKPIKCNNGVFEYDGNIIKFEDISCTQDCWVNTKTEMNKIAPPIVLSSPNNPPEYFYPPPDNPGNLVFKTGSTVTVVCPGKSNAASTQVVKEGVVLVEGQPLDSTKPIECKKGVFEYNGKTINFKDISCHEAKGSCYNAIQREVRRKCNRGRNDMYEIGYDLLAGRGFLRTIDFCHDIKNAKTLWAHDVIVPTNQQKYRFSGPGKSFKVANLYQKMKMSKKDPYNLEKAFNNAVKILGSTAAALYFSTKTNDPRYLAKGHLVANADKFYKSEQDSTYFYANAVPMWQRINANPGNWFYVEEYARYLAFKKGRVLDIYIGGIGTSKLQGKEIDLYLSDDGQKKLIPVPKIIYKCVIDHQFQEAICFLVVNNPYVSKQEIEKPGTEYIICPTIQNCNSYIPNYDKAERGYLYCCNLKDFYVETRDELGLEEIAPYIRYNEMTLIRK